MRRPGSIILGCVAALLTAAGLLLHGCRDNADTPTGPHPQFARVKPDKSLTVSAASTSTGSGHITAPQVLEVSPLDCYITGHTYDPSSCTKTYPWKSTVTLTATADQGSSFAGWSGACTGTASTCRVMMSVARSVQASFSGTAVPSFALHVVGTGTGSGTVSSQTGLTPAINCTITTGTASGTCSATYPSTTSVTLTAAPATGNTFDGWSGACTGTGSCVLSMTADKSVTAGFSAPAGPEATVGKWDQPQFNPIIGLHLSNLGSSKLLLWGSVGEPQTWTIAGGGFTQVTNATCTNPTTCELFCSGHTFLADGRLLVAGGESPLGSGYGLNQASTFDGTSWLATGSMTYGRWYPTLVELADGNVVAISGSQDPNTNASIPERYNGSSWTALTGASLSLPLFPRAFLEPKNGRVFYAGEASPSRYLDPSGAGVWTTGPSRRVSDRSYGSAVMLDSKVLYIGGGGGTCPTAPQNTAEVLDLSAGTPTWNSVASMTFHRRQTNATILPDGTVLVTGGTSTCGFTDEAGAVYAAENYNPATNTWTTWSNASVIRVYHSTTNLLPDGRVLSTGSGDGGGVTDQHTYEIFSPPYLFKGTRPSYNLTSTQMHYGVPFTVTTSDAASITKVTLIRLASTTHAFDQGQRLNTLAFQAAADGQSLTVTPPSAALLAPPGPYMLFIVNDKGIPSVAQTVLVSQ